MKKNYFYLFMLLSIPASSYAQVTQVAYQGDGGHVGTNSSYITAQGGLYVGGNAATNTGLYVKGDVLLSGDRAKITQKGKTLLTGDFVDNVTDLNNHAFDPASAGVVEFAGTTKQHIRGFAVKDSLNSPGLGGNYINFPNVTINNPQTVEERYDMGMSVNHLTLTQGPLVLTSTPMYNFKRATDIAHLLVQNVTYSADATHQGVVQVELAAGIELDPTFHSVKTFSSPYKTLYSDYFTCSGITKPNQSGFSGSSGLITAQNVAMNAGEGYLIMQDMYDQSQWASKGFNLAHYNARFDSTYVFNRFAFQQGVHAVNAATMKSTNMGLPQYAGEKLNTTDVTVAAMSASMLAPGLNFVGNPFTTALDMREFLAQSPNFKTDWGVSASEVSPSYTVFSPGKVKVVDASINSLLISETPRLVQAVGSTDYVDTIVGGHGIIAPMQMFAINVKKRGRLPNFKIPANQRIQTKASYLKSTKMEEANDELLIRVVDQATQADDRLTVVFRPDASLDATDLYDSPRYPTAQGYGSQIFTVSRDRMPLTANIVPTNTKSEEMYLKPSLLPTKCVLSAHRLASLHSVEGVWLEDRLKPSQKWVDLSEGDYTFSTNKSDRQARFVLHFTPQTQSKMASLADLQASYSDGTLRIAGIANIDLGSNVQIFDMQGHALYKGVIDQEGIVEKQVTLNPGIYVVRISGKRFLNAKILATN